MKELPQTYGQALKACQKNHPLSINTRTFTFYTEVEQRKVGPSLRMVR
jgi:hypothetical protein